MDGYILIFLVTGCSQGKIRGYQNENEDEKTTEHTIINSTEVTEPEILEGPIHLTISQNLSYLDGMEDKNHLFVKYHDKVYYRQYHEDSFQEGGVFQYYQPIGGSNSIW